MLKSISLNGKWGFIIDPSNRGVTWCKYQEENPEKAGDLSRGFRDLLPDEVEVPGSWQNYAEKYQWYDRTAFFFKKFPKPRMAKGERIFLRLEGISFRGRAWLNGQEIGSIDFPYLPWEMEITGHLHPQNFLVVRIEGAPQPEDTIPIFGWRNFAGILRDVNLLVTGPVRLGTVLLDPRLDLAEGHGALQVRFEAEEAKGLRVGWSLSGHGIDLHCKATVAPAQKGWHHFETPPAPVAFWSPENPVTYTFRLELLDRHGGVLDRYECATGFRKFEARADGFYLNGKRTWLRGISRHNFHPDHGMTVRRDWLEKDFALIEDLHCNALRLAHLPNDTVVLDECDQRGLLAWVEVPVYWDAPLGCKATRERMLAQVNSMMRRDYNHPSVVIWSVANEIRSEKPEGLRALRAARRLVKTLETSRPMTFASWPRDPARNLGLKCIDFCAMNLYRGWYQPETKQLEADLASIRKYAPHLPIILSEFGAGAVAGLRGSKTKRWTEDFQARVISDNMSTVRELGHGCFPWVLADFSDPSRVYAKITEGFLNNKGLVSEDRKKRKLAFRVVSERYAQWAKEDA